MSQYIIGKFISCNILVFQAGWIMSYFSCYSSHIFNYSVVTNGNNHECFFQRPLEENGIKKVSPRNINNFMFNNLLIIDFWRPWNTFLQYRWCIGARPVNLSMTFSRPSVLLNKVTLYNNPVITLCSSRKYPCLLTEGIFF